MKNPWLEDAAKGATGQTYEIRTLLDFFQVPEDRRCICLREFHAWLAVQEGVRDLMVATGHALGSPLDGSAIQFDNDVFLWIDDGDGAMRVHIKPVAAPGR